jgi:hypothetical protein
VPLTTGALGARGAHGVLSYVIVNGAIIPSERVPFAIVHAEFDDGLRFTAPVHGAVSAALSGRRVRWTVGTVGERRSAQFELVGDWISVSTPCAGTWETG